MQRDADATTRHVVIVGGGISGLAAAYRLQTLARASRQPVQITLLEADDRLGGKILTERSDDLVIEAGPDSFLSQKPAALTLAEELGLEDRIVGTSEAGGGTYILRNGRLEPLPEGITMLVPTKLGPLLRSRLLSPLGKLRMGLDFVIPPRRDEGDESVAAFVSRRLGREAFERMAQPLLSGIYAGDAEQLSILATFPRLRETERRHGSLTRGMLAQRRQAKSVPPSSPRRSAFLSFKSGMAELSDALAAALEQVDVRVGARVDRVEQGPEGRYRVSVAGNETFDADAVLLSTPAYVSADLLEPIAPDLSDTLRQIPYVSTATITMAFDKADVERLGAGRGFVIPRVENRELTAVTWVTNKFPGRAPEDRALVRAFVGRAGREGAVDLDDQDLLALVRQELQEILGISEAPRASWIFRWHRALPQYTLGHTERLARLDARVAALPGLDVLGAAYRGVGIPDCIQSGQAAADRVATYLGLPTTVAEPSLK